MKCAVHKKIPVSSNKKKYSIIVSWLSFGDGFKSPFFPSYFYKDTNKKIKLNYFSTSTGLSWLGK